MKRYAQSRKLIHIFNEAEDNVGNEMEQKIYDFFVEHPDPEDSEVHALAGEMGLDPDEIEEVIYKLLGSLIGGGKSKGVKPEGISEEEFDLGLKVELEHTDNEMLARKITYDHLTDRKDYYTFGRDCGIFDELK